MQSFLFILTFCFSLSCLAARHLVVIPGFFSAVHEAEPQPPGLRSHFSSDVIRFFESRGFNVQVVDNLNRLGSIEENGQRVIDYIQANLNFQEGDSLTLMGHSAGGLYALYAIAHSNLPVSRVVSLSTPYGGLRFLQTLEDEDIPLDSLAPIFELGNILQLKEASVQVFLRNLKIHRDIRLDVFASSQKLSHWTWNWRVIGKPLILFHRLGREESDGIVTIRSALAAQALKNSNPDLQLVIHEEILNLDHMEYTLKASSARKYGVLNTSSLRRGQFAAYSRILELMSFQ